MKTKRCNKCRKIKPADQFNLLISKGDTRRNRCRSCEHDLQKSRGLKIPQRGAKYEVTKITMRNHMYLHFGWWESRMTAIDRDQSRKDVKKYYKEERQVEYKRDK